MEAFLKYGLLKHLIVSSIVHLIVPTLVSWFYPLFSYEHLLFPEQLPLKYDEILYFHNNYEFQPDHAFMFGYVYITKLAKVLFGYKLGMVALLIINKLAYLSAGLDLLQILKNLAQTSLQDSQRKQEQKEKKTRRLPYYGMLFYLYNPAGIFFNSVYTQAIFSFLSFKAIKYLLVNEQFVNHQLFSKIKGLNFIVTTQPLFMPIFLLFLAASIKSNGMLLSAVIGLQIIKGVFTIKEPAKWIKNVMKGVCILLILLLPYLAHGIFTYYNICVWAKNQSDLCHHNIFSIYGAVQQKFWQVGFMKHYTMRNILFIILGTPAIILGGIGLTYYTKSFNMRQSGLYLSFLLLWITTTFFANIQPSTRFFCANPYFYYILAKIDQKTVIARHWSISYWLAGIFFFTLRFIWV